MDTKNGFTITNRDHVLRAWQNSTELVRDYQAYAHELEEDSSALANCFPSLRKMKRNMPQNCLIFCAGMKNRHLETV